jgi:hypothetical protein
MQKMRVESGANVGIPLQAFLPLTSKSGLADCYARAIWRLCQQIRDRYRRIAQEFQSSFCHTGDEAVKNSIH